MNGYERLMRQMQGHVFERDEALNLIKVIMIRTPGYDLREDIKEILKL